MKIGIIGGGFYGCYLAYKLIQLNNKKYEVTIFEKRKNLLSESAINNQYRLHKGFHYPRSINTIKQTNKGSNYFLKEFKKFVYFPKYNIYAIHKQSLIKFRDYIKIYKKNKISFKVLKEEKIKKFFKNPNNIEGAINVREGVIKLDDLYKFIKSKIKDAIIKTNITVDKIDNAKKRVYFKKKHEDFDLIINCTFTNPNMGLEKKYFNIKYEIASMLHVKNFLNKNTAITLMDGNFGSLYPINSKTLTLSSVKHTPFKKFRSLDNYNKFLASKNFKKYINHNSVKILNHLSKFFTMPKKINIRKITNSPKVKIIRDYDDQRLSIIKFDKNVISILCGKLDAVYLAWNKIKSKI